MTAVSVSAKEKLIVVNEGNWQTDNGKLSYFEDGKVVSNQWFRDVNGYKLGDTPNDIIQINDNLIAIAINWSNIVQFITPEGKAVAATEKVPNNRKLASDGKYVYVTSYGHECNTVDGMVYFTKGYVAKIDLSTFQVVATCEVGYEPEGIAIYRDHLFIANTGGYAFQEPHAYETTVSIVDANTMQKVKDVDTGQINLYGKMSRSGRYLCINSPGDYYDVMAATVIFDCEAALKGDAKCFTKLDYASTYNCINADGDFFAIGSRYSYYTGDYKFNYITIDPREVMETNGAKGVTEDMPGTLGADIKKISMPYGIYVNPYTGYIYATDAGEFVSAGSLYQWTPDGKLVGKYKIYINPGHFLALPPDGKFDAVNDITADAPSDDRIFNLQGMPVTHPVPGQIYIQNGKKFIQR
jgi:DNA-binding beta-propeller fold protein YncE